MRMTNYSASFLIQSDDPFEAKSIFALGQSTVAPRASGIMMDNGRGIQLFKAEREDIFSCVEWMKSNSGIDGWSFDTLCQAALRGESSAFAR